MPKLYDFGSEEQLMGDSLPGSVTRRMSYKDTELDNSRHNRKLKG